MIIIIKQWCLCKKSRSVKEKPKIIPFSSESEFSQCLCNKNRWMIQTKYHSSSNHNTFFLWFKYAPKRYYWPDSNCMQKPSFFLLYSKCFYKVSFLKSLSAGLLYMSSFSFIQSLIWHFRYYKVLWQILWDFCLSNIYSPIKWSEHLGQCLCVWLWNLKFDTGFTNRQSTAVECDQ